MEYLIAILLEIFSADLPSLVTASDPSSLIADPLFMALLIALGFVVGTAIGASGIGGAVLIVPSLLYLGVVPQAMVGASLIFNFITNIPSTALHGKKRNISWSALIYLMITVIPSLFIANWLWVHVEANYGSKTLDVIILLPIGMLLVAIESFMVKNHLNKKNKRNLTLEDQEMKLCTNFSKTDKGALLSMGGLVSFLIQISSVGAGAFLAPVLLRVLRSPKHVAGTSVTFGLIVALMGAILHYTLEDIPIYLIAVLLIGSIPGSLLGVRIASTASPRRLTLIFAVIILVAGLLISNRGIADLLQVIQY